uniref:2Fe-2S ferredoxin-type domain-containing protein n=1 Tax=Bicosoecida sp. CB-2014 TaxID=1486930 RepID=A0A7S1CBW9_9STRA
MAAPIVLRSVLGGGRARAIGAVRRTSSIHPSTAALARAVEVGAGGGSESVPLPVSAAAAAAQRRHGSTWAVRRTGGAAAHVALGASRRGPVPPVSGVRWHGDDSDVEEVPDDEKITVVYVDKDGEETVARGNPGQNLLRLAQKFGVELEGACECSLACSTCHVILEDEVFDSLPEASEDEDDLLDMAFGLTATSRLGCQVKLTRDLDGMRVQLPAATRNFYVDGHVPQPH